MLVNVKEPSPEDPDQSEMIRSRNQELKMKLNALVDFRARTWPNSPPDIDSAIAELYFKRHYYFVWRMFPINDLVRFYIHLSPPSSDCSLARGDPSEDIPLCGLVYARGSPVLNLSAQNNLGVQAVALRRHQRHVPLEQDMVPRPSTLQSFPCLP